MGGGLMNVDTSGSLNHLHQELDDGRAVGNEEDENMDDMEAGEDDESFEMQDPVEDENYDFMVGEAPIRYVGVDIKGTHSSKIFQTPNGTRYWCPDVPDEYKPVVGKVYSSFNEIRRMYETYGDKAGFGIRLTAYKKDKGVITHRLLTCNRAGTPKCKKVDSVQPMSYGRIRGTSYKVTNCKALIRMRIVKGTKSYMIYKFSENHNHDLVSSDNMDLTRKSRHLNFDDIQFIHKMSLQKIGPVAAHRLHTSLKGGHHNMNGTRNSYKAVGREIKMFIGNRDVKCFVKGIKDRAASRPNFAYEILHDGKELNGIFWADEMSRVSYQTFGDVLAFDATYSTNVYNMIFVPFTGVDHHRKCVLFGAGLIRDETIESYEWLLHAFLSIHSKQPRLILTDQDPAMRIAVPNVFNKSAHRLCMWHIMKKLPSKIAGDVLQNTDLRRSLHKLVWNVFITPSTFEERWENIIKEYKLENNAWLTDMYVIKDLWVPAYFRDIPMCCLMKTTSRCESSNALFKVNSSPSNTLSQFIMAFDNALDQQRYGQRIEEFKTNTTVPEMRSGEKLEEHAARVYTGAVFKDVQKEILRSMTSCFTVNVDTENESVVYTISHFNHYSNYVNQFQVIAQVNHTIFDCSCNGFTRTGYLCRHIFLVFRMKKITEIPTMYVLKHWHKQALPSHLYGVENRLSADTSEFSALRNEVLDCVNVCVDHLAGRLEALNCFAEKIKDIKKQVLADSIDNSPAEKRVAAIRSFYGNDQNSVVDVEDVETELSAPQGIRNKGCGTNRRLVGPGEKAVEQSKKNPRLCRLCNQLGYHDSRNCKAKVKEDASEN